MGTQESGKSNLSSSIVHRKEAEPILIGATRSGSSLMGSMSLAAAQKI